MSGPSLAFVSSLGRGAKVAVMDFVNVVYLGVVDRITPTGYIRVVPGDEPALGRLHHNHGASALFYSTGWQRGGPGLRYLAPRPEVGP